MIAATLLNIAPHLCPLTFLRVSVSLRVISRYTVTHFPRVTDLTNQSPASGGHGPMRGEESDLLTSPGPDCHLSG